MYSDVCIEIQGQVLELVLAFHLIEAGSFVFATDLCAPNSWPTDFWVILWFLWLSRNIGITYVSHRIICFTSPGDQTEIVGPFPWPPPPDVSTFIPFLFKDAEGNMSQVSWIQWNSYIRACHICKRKTVEEEWLFEKELEMLITQLFFPPLPYLRNIFIKDPVFVFFRDSWTHQFLFKSSLINNNSPVVSHLPSSPIPPPGPPSSLQRRAGLPGAWIKQSITS